MFNRYSVTIGDALWTSIYENLDMETYSLVEVLEKEDQKLIVLQNRVDNSYSAVNFSQNEEGYQYEEVVAYSDYTPAEEVQFAAADVEAFEVSYKKKSEEEEEKKEDNSSDEDKKEEEAKEESDNDSAEDESKEEEEDDKKKKKYNLEEVEEYTELLNRYNELENKYSLLETEFNQLKETNESLTQFKLSAERIEKENMIEKFYMISEEDKADVVTNIDKYSLEDIEAKLAVICVRKGLSFATEEKKEEPTTYNLNDNTLEDDIPAWIKAVMDTEKTLK